MNDPSRLLPENLLSISWHDSHWIPLLGPHNVMDYFSERTNPFYDRTCNNEVLKMQRASLDQLPNMQGVEYCLLYVQEPILYVIRKQHRNSPTHVTPIADYYIIAGIVYQAPDMGSVLNSRILSSVCHLQSAFEEARSYARYHPSKGYWWDFNKQTSSGAPPGAKVVKTAVSAGDKANKKPAKSKEERFKEEPSSLFQRRRVDVLLDLLTRKFPPKVPNAAAPPPPPPPASASSSSASVAAATSTASSSTSSSAAAATAPPDQKPDTKELPAVSAPAVKSEPDSRGIKREASGGVSQAQDAKRLKL